MAAADACAGMGAGMRAALLTRTLLWLPSRRSLTRNLPQPATPSFHSGKSRRTDEFVPARLLIRGARHCSGRAVGLASAQHPHTRNWLRCWFRRSASSVRHSTTAVVYESTVPREESADVSTARVDLVHSPGSAAEPPVRHGHSRRSRDAGGRAVRRAIDTRHDPRHGQRRAGRGRPRRDGHRDRRETPASRERS